MHAYLEHANLHVADVDRMLDFVRTALPAFRIRYDSGASAQERWVHVGDERSYLALYQARRIASGQPEPYDGSVQMNHLGFVVGDVSALRQRLLERGYLETTTANNHPARRRVYFRDGEGNEWEFVEYLHGHERNWHAYDDVDTLARR